MRLVLGLTALLLTAVAAFAQPPEGAGGDRLQRMKQHLDLSDEQVQQIQQIRADGGSREDVHALLTDEQRAKADKMRASHSKRGGDRLEKMQQHLGLSDDQVQQMRDIREQGGSREEMHAVLTDEQKQQLQAFKQSHGGKGRHGK